MAARTAALERHQSSSGRSELSMYLRIANNPKPLLYLDARQWLEGDAMSHADRSPRSLECFLPTGRKSFYWYQYTEDRRVTL